MLRKITKLKKAFYDRYKNHNDFEDRVEIFNVIPVPALVSLPAAPPLVEGQLVPPSSIPASKEGDDGEINKVPESVRHTDEPRAQQPVAAHTPTKIVTGRDQLKKTVVETQFTASNQDADRETIIVSVSDEPQEEPLVQGAPPPPPPPAPVDNTKPESPQSSRKKVETRFIASNKDLDDGKTIPDSDNGRVDLLAQIRQGTKLKKAQKDEDAQQVKRIVEEEKNPVGMTGQLLGNPMLQKAIDLAPGTPERKTENDDENENDWDPDNIKTPSPVSKRPQVMKTSSITKQPKGKGPAEQESANSSPAQAGLFGVKLKKVARGSSTAAANPRGRGRGTRARGSGRGTKPPAPRGK